MGRERQGVARVCREHECEMSENGDFPEMTWRCLGDVTEMYAYDSADDT